MLITLLLFFINTVVRFSTIEYLDGTVFGDGGKDVRIDWIEFKILGFIIEVGSIENVDYFGRTEITVDDLIAVT
jgi:hypothetical protein